MSPTTAAEAESLPEAVLAQQVLQLVGQHDLRQLLRCSAVSRRWHSASQHVLSCGGPWRLEPPGNVTAQGMVWLGSTEVPVLGPVRSLAVNGAATVAGLAFLTTSELGRQRLGALRELSVDTSRQLRDDVLASTLQHCTALRSLSLIDTPRISDAGVLNIALHCTALTRLCLKDVHGIYDDAVAHLASKCPQLQEVALDGALHISSASLEALGACCAALRRVSLARCTRVRDAGLRALAAGCPHLESVCVAQCHGLTAVGCLSGCPLETLDLCGTSKVTRAELRALAAPEGRAARSLRRLLLDGCGGLDGGDALVELCRACSSLQELRVCNVADLGDAHLEQLAPHCGALRVLGLVWCPQVTDKGLHALVAAAAGGGGGGLRELDVEACFDVADGLLQSVARHAPLLERLNVRMCNALTAGALWELCGGGGACRRLRVVHMASVLPDAQAARLAARVREAQLGVRLLY